MEHHATQYTINVTYCDELEVYIASFDNRSSDIFGEGETRYLAIDNLLSNCDDRYLEEFYA